MNNRIPQQYAEKYLKGGKANVVFHNITTKQQKKFTIIAAHRDRNDKNSPVTGYFVYVTGEPGWISRIDMANQIFINPLYPKDHMRWELAANFNWVWKRVISRAVPDNIHILHLGRCSICGRELTDAQSLERGIGPICAGI